MKEIEHCLIEKYESLSPKQITCNETKIENKKEIKENEINQKSVDESKTSKKQNVNENNKRKMLISFILNNLQNIAQNPKEKEIEIEIEKKKEEEEEEKKDGNFLQILLNK